jgi:hypothetical protein
MSQDRQRNVTPHRDVWHIIDIGEVISEFCAVSEKLALRVTCQSACTAVANVASRMLPPQVSELQVALPHPTDHWSHYKARKFVSLSAGHQIRELSMPPVPSSAQPTLRLLSTSPSFLPYLDTVSFAAAKGSKRLEMEVLCTARAALRSIKGVNFSVCNWDSELPLACVGLTKLSLVFDCLRDSASLARNALEEACPALRQLELFVDDRLGRFITMLNDFFADPHPNRIEALTIRFSPSPNPQMRLTRQPWLQNLLRGFPVLTSVTLAPSVLLDDAFSRDFLLALAPRIRHLEGLDITSLAWPNVLFPALESVHECEFRGVELSILLRSAPALHTLWAVALGANIMASLAQCQAYGKVLRTLGLRENEAHLGSFCDDVALVANDRTSLRTLQLVGVIEINVARSVMSAVSATIEDLRIQRCPGFRAELLNEWLPACSNLVSIHLDVLGQFNFQVFASLSRLQSVEICIVGSTVAPTDVDALPGNLTRLCISGARIVDPAAVVQVLAQKSPRLLQLRLLDFANRDIAVLVNATSLRYLQSVEGVYVDEANVKYLHRLGHLTYLQYGYLAAHITPVRVSAHFPAFLVDHIALQLSA